MELRDWNIGEVSNICSYNLSIKPVNLKVQYKTDGTPYIFYEGIIDNTYKIIIPCLEMKFDQLSIQFSQHPKILSLNNNKCYVHPAQWNGTTIYFLTEKINDELFDWSDSNEIF